MDKSSLPNPDKTGLCGRGTEGACIITRPPGNGVLSFRMTARYETGFSLSPGLFPCAAGIPIPPKTIAASRAGVYTLLQNAYWVLNPNSGKGPPSAAFSSSLTGRLRVLPGASNHEVYSQPVKSLVFSTCKGA